MHEAEVRTEAVRPLEVVQCAPVEVAFVIEQGWAANTSQKGLTSQSRNGAAYGPSARLHDQYLVRTSTEQPAAQPQPQRFTIFG